MKVILLRDVAKIGRRNEVREVPDGHALNFLIPRKFALPATPEALRKLQVEANKKTIMTERHDTDFKSSLLVLSKEPVVLTLPANPKGSLFKSVRAQDIVASAAEKGITLREDEVVLPHPIKEIGDYPITLRSHGTEGVMTLRITRA
jgi:large subunit ribosomal protein L9